MVDKGSGDAADLAREESRTIREDMHPPLCRGKCCIDPSEYR